MAVQCTRDELVRQAVRFQPNFDEGKDTIVVYLPAKERNLHLLQQKIVSERRKQGKPVVNIAVSVSSELTMDGRQIVVTFS